MTYETFSLNHWFFSSIAIFSDWLEAIHVRINHLLLRKELKVFDSFLLLPYIQNYFFVQRLVLDMVTGKLFRFVYCLVFQVFVNYSLFIVHQNLLKKTEYSFSLCLSGKSLKQIARSIRLCFFYQLVRKQHIKKTNINNPAQMISNA